MFSFVKNIYKKQTVIILLLVISMYSVRAFLGSGFIPTHDGEYHIVRLWQFDRSIQEGNLLPIWAPDLNNGYGVPIFEFFYPLPSYVGEVFHLSGFGFIDSLKLVLASGLIISSLTFYLWVKSFFKTLPSLVGSVSYVLAPYHMVDVNVRGSIGEVWALALVPLVLFFVTRLLNNKNRIWFSLFGLSTSSALLLISHNIIGIIFFALSFVYGAIFCLFEKKPLRLLIYGLILSLAISAFFWLPLIFESRFVTGLDIINYNEHFPALFQLIFPSWGTGFSQAGISDQMSFQIGLVHLFASFAGAVIAIRQRKYFLLTLLSIWLMSVLMMLEGSNVIWTVVSPLQIMQFPWRLLSVSILLSSFIIAYVSQQNTKLAFGLLFASLLLYFPYTNPVVYQPRKDSLYTKNQEWISGTTTWGNTFNLKGFSRPATIHVDEFTISEGSGKIKSSNRSVTVSKAEVYLDSAGIIELKRAYFPGWQASIDSVAVPIDSSNDGIIRMSVPAGQHSIIVWLGSSPVRTTANSVSLISLILLFGITTFKLYENRLRHIAA